MNLRKRVIAILILSLISCNFASQVVSSPTPAYVGETPEPTAGPTYSYGLGTPAATALPATLPAIQTGDVAGFRDHLAVADQFLLTLSNVPAPPAGQAYQGWLIGDDGAASGVGALPLNPDGSIAFTWNSPSSENLLSRYARFQITLEPAAGSAAPTGNVIFAGGLDGAALANARQLFVRNDAEPLTPLNTAFASGLLAQTELAAQHVTNASNAAAIGALPEMRTHLEHVINILEGANGPRFGDHDGNGTAENPGDGFGVINYSGQIASRLSEQATVVESAAGIQAQVIALQDKCFAILNLNDASAAAAELGALKMLVDQLKTGVAADLYRTAQDAMTFEIAPVD